MGISNEDLVRKFLDSNAINWEGIGKVIAEVGPELSIGDNEWRVVTTGPRFIIACVLGFPEPDDVIEDLEELGAVVTDD